MVFPPTASDHHRGRGGDRAGVASHAVEFTVRNVNRSDLACATDGARYRIRGRVYGPRRHIGRARTVTLYLHGLELGAFFWTDEVRGRSFVQRQARAGHVSVVVDRLGYDSSGKPDGFASCLGGQADIADQIVRRLRGGDYATGDRHRSRAYRRVVLGGHSVGGLLSILTAGSFDRVDGIVVASYSAVTLTDAAKAAAAANAAACAAGGQRTEGGDFPGGYAPFAPTAADFRASFFLSTNPRVADRVTEKRNLNPCGDTATFAAGSRVDAELSPTIRVPVLVIAGRQDAIFGPNAVPSQAALFTGSRRVTRRILSPSSHSVTIEAPAPRFAKSVARWLDRNGLGR